tara:strand:- start:653 stop:928 length:276 start_codon:yes stop_codon:yes gene_type:complete
MQVNPKLNLKYVLTWDVPTSKENFGAPWVAHIEDGEVASTSHRLDIQSDSINSIKAVMNGLIAIGVTSFSLYEHNGEQYVEIPLPGEPVVL